MNRKVRRYGGPMDGAMVTLTSSTVPALIRVPGLRGPIVDRHDYEWNRVKRRHEHAGKAAQHVQDIQEDHEIHESE